MMPPITYLISFSIPFALFRKVAPQKPYRKLIPPKPLQNAGDSTFLTATQLSQPLHEPTLKPNHRCSRILPSSETTDRKSW